MSGQSSRQCPASPVGERTARTFRYDMVRGSLHGILEAGLLPFTLLVAIRHFDASIHLKALLNAAPSIGLLLTPLSVHIVVGRRMHPLRACAFYLFTSSFLLAGMAVVGSLWAFSTCFIVHALIFSQQTPLNVQIYAQNYTAKERGARVSQVFIAGSLLGAVFGFLGGRALDRDIASAYPLLFVVMAIAAFFVAWAYLMIPGDPLAPRQAIHPLHNLRLMRSDPLFGHLLTCWMIMGLGNLLAVPIRLEYLANPSFGINATNTETALLIIFIPLIARVLTALAWGWAFDRFDLITTRNLLNVFFVVGTVLFFSTTHFAVMAIAAALYGIAVGGGSVVWQLWVTKIAPPDQVSDYMSVHSMLTGVRGVIAPFLGYAILKMGSPQLVAGSAGVLIAIAMLAFERVRLHPRIVQNGA